ncbi:MAG: hypothetical protein HY042_03030 [Spirochaetia bacterium]|nr:hypothetical protein [Spirochaetia bacterium]
MKDRMCRAVEQRLADTQWDCSIALKVTSRVKNRRKKVSNMVLAALLGCAIAAVAFSRVEQAVAQIAAADASEALEGSFPVAPAEQSVSRDMQLIVQTAFIQ